MMGPQFTRPPRPDDVQCWAEAEEHFAAALPHSRSFGAVRTLTETRHPFSSLISARVGPGAGWPRSGSEI